MSPGTRIDYKELRKLSPEAAREAVLQYLDTNGANIADAARAFGINRPVVYDILRKQAEGDLRDRPRVPKHQPNKTPPEVEELVVGLKNRVGMGCRQLSKYLKKYEGVHVPYGTIRNILRRNRHLLTHPGPRCRRRREKREFVDWYSAKPFEIVQADLKYIRDQKALTKEQIIHLDRSGIPNFQWGALDVNSRFKIIAYSRERSWTNGLCFYLWVVAWLRSHGVTARIVFTVDNGEEFGGQSPMKIRELRKLLSGFGCRVIQNRKGHPEDNAHLERSHLTDDDEFYRVRAMAIHSEEDLLNEATGYIYYYNNVRDHSSLDDQPPFTHLKQQQPNLDDNIRYVQPFMLDDVSVALGPWSGYNVLAQHRAGLCSERVSAAHRLAHEFRLGLAAARCAGTPLPQAHCWQLVGRLPSARLPLPQPKLRRINPGVPTAVPLHYNVEVNRVPVDAVRHRPRVPPATTAPVGVGRNGSALPKRSPCTDADRTTRACRRGNRAASHARRFMLCPQLPQLFSLR